MKKGREKERLTTMEEVVKALETLNSPADRSDPEGDREKRLKANEVISKWSVTDPKEPEDLDRTAYINNALGVGLVPRGISQFDDIKEGRKYDTGIVRDTNRGTGLPKQVKYPRDLRTNEE